MELSNISVANKKLMCDYKTSVLVAVKGNDEACIVQSNSTKAKNLLYFKKLLSFSYSFFREIVRKLNWAIPKKSTPPQRKACWEISREVGVNGCGNPDGRGALSLKIHPQGLLSISFMFQLLQWVSFRKNALHF